ncbi:MAG: arylesterase [Cytophagales bacterium]|nr:arylesterase [Cytophagales bacterium]
MTIFKLGWLRLVSSLILGVASAAALAASPVKVLVVGDSLSAEYGLPRSTGWVHLLAQKLAAEKINAQISNASISGETTSGGLSRLPALLRAQAPKVVIIELGANDALRGLAMPQTEKNLSEMVRLSQKAGAKVLLLGMQMPPNFGRAYAKEFAAVFQHIAQSNRTALVPFFLKGVADAPNARELFQADGIHPVAAAHPTMLANVWPELMKLLK